MGLGTYVKVASPYHDKKTTIVVAINATKIVSHRKKKKNSY